MRRTQSQTVDYARVLLALIRFINGSLGLVAPGIIARRLGADPNTNPATLYALRMFGIRTLLISIDLLHPDSQVRARAVRNAPIIHASDSVAAMLAARSGKLPGRTGATIVAISAVNTLLALLAQPADRRK